MHELLLAGCSAAGLAATGATAWLPVLYWRACREQKREQETGR
jgi:hypothetical protein